MNERPILFSGEMVRAILAGKKTQTRRTLKQQPIDILPMNVPDEWVTLETRNPTHGRVIKCRYGEPGDRLWVREAFWHYGVGSELGGRQLYYKCDMDLPSEFQIDNFMKWRPSIHMPRWASRITLEVVNVRVQRVQEISEDDADAEGAPPIAPGFETVMYSWYEGKQVVCSRSPLDWYQYTWDQINAKRGYSWESNPWVWVIEFQRVAP